MLKGLVKNMVSMGLALLVLFSTLSFTINEHYCGDELQDVAWFVKADTCMMGMDTAMPQGVCATVKDSCCTDVVQIVQGQDDLQASFSQFTLEQQDFVAAFFLSYIAAFKLEAKDPILTTAYRPPLLVRDIQLLDDVFLI
ncbi:hypothetical protein GCM10011416_00800 [Polaribacter pacificus]|uniref:Uncharacterized protein n=1 Tax=Polaribacter pacificus TaxID=1775173 RepID=A0A917HTF2_9FLAO|nr:hypothetical protein [Polaribacter pacificus]GGG88392.1 hypothetical protein GCM10011416_00800 [Polaribacter pacificus]